MKKTETKERAVLESPVKDVSTPKQQEKQEKQVDPNAMARLTEDVKSLVAESGEVDRFGLTGEDFVVVRPTMPSLDQLSLENKLYLYHIHRAAVLGNDILYLQNHHGSIYIKRFLEEVYLTTKEHIEEPIKEAILEYLSYIWFHHGQYHHRTRKKFLPNYLTVPMLERAMKLAQDKGADFSFIPGGTDQDKIYWLFPLIFDPREDSWLWSLEPSKDLVAGGASNLYDKGITTEMIQELAEEDRLCPNCRFTLTDEGVQAVRFRVAGAYDHCLQQIVQELQSARAYAEPGPQMESLDGLIDHFTTGSVQAFQSHSEAWVQSRPVVDYVLGFIEPFRDPRGVVGTFQGVAWVPAYGELLRRIGEAVVDWEEKMPWPDRFKRSEPQVPQEVIIGHAVVGTGDMGPLPWSGFSLPNLKEVRDAHGTKYIVLANLLDRESREDRHRLVNEFFLPEYRADVLQWGSLSQRLVIILHELVGHPSGQPDSALQGEPRDLLGRMYAPLEEARADLVALHLLADPVWMRWGVVPKGQGDRFFLAALVNYLQGVLMEQAEATEGTSKTPHRRGRYLVLRYLTSGGRGGRDDYGVRVVERPEGFFVEVVDGPAAKMGLQRLLGLLQTYKSTGDQRSAEALFQRLTEQHEPSWRADMEERLARLRRPRYVGFIFPRLEKVASEGSIVDIRVVQDHSFAAQQLRFSSTGACCACP